MIRILSMALAALLLNTNNVNGAKNHLPLSAEIDFAANASHIVKIGKDTIVVTTGKTYSFTVDTPEDQGLVYTKPGVEQLLNEIVSKDGSVQNYKVISKNGDIKTKGSIDNGDRLVVTSQDGKTTKKYFIAERAMALGGKLLLAQETVTVNTNKDLTLFFTAGQRTPEATVRIYLPAGVNATMNNTTVNVIGRGDVKLKDLSTQSIGRTGTHYSYSKVGEVVISKLANGTSVIIFSHIDLRPDNGTDIKLVISDVNLSKIGNYLFKATYSTSKPEILISAGVGPETANLKVTTTISDFERTIDKSLQYKGTSVTQTSANFTWSTANKASGIQLMQSLDQGKTWSGTQVSINSKDGKAKIDNLVANKLYLFRLLVKDGENKGSSNITYFYSGKMDIKNFGITGEDNKDYTEIINQAIDSISKIGGGTLFFSKGTYSVRTVHLKSNVWLYVGSDATIKALKGGDAPEPTWFSDKKYRSGLSPTDIGPYENPENWLTKQDVGHHYFRNTMFFGERLDNVKIIGNGLITGNGNLVTGDKVMNNAPDNRSDKMFTFKLCTNIEIGGIHRYEDLWYDEEKDLPYYIGKDGSKIEDISNMLHIDRAGHFALLATGTDNINVHNTYFGKNSTSTARDIYDFMACNNVTVTNIFSKTSSDDIVKPGSDCSLGFTRPSSKFRVRNIIGDTNCNLFQIGSETADDITDACVDNIYVLGANKAGFSISTNDGGHVKNIHLNCGETGPVHLRSKMYRTTTPFFISISNRARILGADVEKYSFSENGEKRNELLVKNVNIGEVENIILNGIDIYEVYSGSSYSGNRWKPYDGTQRKATPIIAGYQLPDPSLVEGGLNFKLPNGKHTGYIKNIVFNDVHVLVKGGNPALDTSNLPRELGVGQYNVSNLGVQPSYGLWARHVQGLTVKESSFNYQQTDYRYALFLDDVEGGKISGVKMPKGINNAQTIRLKNSKGISIENITYF